MNSRRRLVELLQGALRGEDLLRALLSSFDRSRRTVPGSARSPAARQRGGRAEAASPARRVLPPGPALNTALFSKSVSLLRCIFVSDPTGQQPGQAVCSRHVGPKSLCRKLAHGWPNASQASSYRTPGSRRVPLPTDRLHQPCVVTKAPDANEVNAMVAKTQKLMAACARSFSAG